jgi:lysyl-tRNA synthetase class 2
MLEWYRVGWDHHRLIDETVALVRAALALVGRDATLQVLDYRSLYQAHVELDPFEASLEQLQAPLARVRIDADGLTRDDWLDLLMTHCIQPHFGDDQMTVVHDWPASQAALARVRPGMPPLAERFELYLGAVELANGYHELNDADEQRARFVRDHAVRQARGSVLPPLDERLLDALPALPDCAGVAVGVDRLLMAMNRTGRIADVLAFDFAHA